MTARTHPRPPVVFVSYDAEDVELHDWVLELANCLRNGGVDARIDLYEPGPAEGWELWRERQLRAADFVVVVCTASYRRCFEAHEVVMGGLQVRWEAAFVRRRLHDEPSFGAQVLPVLPRDASAEAVPEVLRRYTRYALPGAYEDLYRRITRQPTIVGPPTATSARAVRASRSPLEELRRSIDNLPSRSLVFEGREGQLDATHEALRRSSKLMTYTVLAGMGGIGKTRLALEHALRCDAEYDLRWWVRAGELASLQADIVRLGVALGILAQPDNVEHSIREVLAWLSTHQRWLVVFDDADGPVTLRDFLPSPCRGHVIITSRARAWRAIAQVVELSRLDPQAATAVLVRRSGRPDDGYADAVAEMLGHLPLALVQAGAYVEATGCSFHDYLERFEQEGLALLDDPKSLPDGDHATVARTWELCLAEIRARTPAAAALLDWLAFLDPGGVPIRLLCEHATTMPATLRSCVGSPRSLDDAIAALREFGLIERAEGVLHVHRLIQTVTRGKLGPAERRELATAVVRWVCSVFIFTPGQTKVGDVPPGSAEQVMAVSAVDALAQGVDRLARVLIDVGDYHAMRGSSHAAHTAYARSLALCEGEAAARPGCTQAQRDLSIALNRLGNVETRAGNLASARRCFSRAFELRRALAYDDPLSPRSQDDLASSLSKLGDVELLDDDVTTAAGLFAQAVELREALVDASPQDPLAWRALALSSRKLAKAQARLGELGDAQRTLQRALGIVEGLSYAVPIDPVARRDLSLVLDDLGDVLGLDGKHEVAGEMFARALGLAEALAKEDPDSAQAQRDLSRCLTRVGLAEQRAGRLAAAHCSLQRALDLRQRLARIDPQDARAQRDLASALLELEALRGPAASASVVLDQPRVDDTAGAIDREHSEARQCHGLPRDPSMHGRRMDGRSGPSRTLPLEQTKSGPCELTRGGRIDSGEPVGAGLKHRETVRHARELEQFGDAALRSGNLGTARQCFHLQVTITRVLATIDPRSTHARHQAARALYNLGKAEHQAGELECARGRLHRCSELFRSLLALDPYDAGMRRDLVKCHRDLGAVELQLGQPERARQVLRGCTASLEALVAEHPRDVTMRRDYAKGLFALGDLEDRDGRLEVARELFQRHLDEAYVAAELDPRGSSTRREILHGLHRLAAIEVRLENLPEARELFRLLLEEDALAEAHPEDAQAVLDLVLLHAEGPLPAA